MALEELLRVNTCEKERKKKERGRDRRQHGSYHHMYLGGGDIEI